MDQDVINKYRKLQSIQLEILEYFDKVARENNIYYYLVFGTLIGAVRHQGFIPWDVDIDISLMREDYEKIVNILRDNEKESPFFVRLPGEKNHKSPHALLYLKETKLGFFDYMYNKNSKYPKEIYIDIFPIDIISENQKKQGKQIKKIKQIRNAILIKNPTYYKPNRLYKFLKWARSLVFFYTSNVRLNKRLTKEMTKFNNLKSSLVCQFACDDIEKTILHINDYGMPEYANFEGLKVPIPKNYDKFLKQVYGDYMKMPSIENQKRYYQNILVVEDRRKK